ncbi:hypothetical protein B0H15DRAFT_1017120 [Mycena belliarum]|uniref:C2H2-type domain-containing protein n=1 Tax=Mycena belliarum TaxID=1033014 RepID=A0AAD6XZE6_9AGAR|nr:hypothetical protein B0H15DRAFT_1017120 [Mycena belliae]
MALPSCTTEGDLNIGDYFDLDAASCDSSSAATSQEFSQTAVKALPSNDSGDAMLERLVLERDTHQDEYHIKLDVAGIYATTYHDASLGLPPATQYAFLESPEEYDSSDSESCWSVPDSPASFLSLLSPPRSPISCEADNPEDDVTSLSEGEVLAFSFDTPSRPTVVPNELSCPQLEPLPTAVIALVPPRNPATVSPSAAHVHAPLPVPPREDTVIRLESIVQGPRELEMERRVRDSTPDSEPSSSGQGVKILDDRPSRSSSPSYEGPVHRVGKPRKPKIKKARVSCSFCRETFTRKADKDRHEGIQHAATNHRTTYLDTGKDRRWCQGCLSILSRSDSRRRHEAVCSFFAEYVENGYVRNPQFLPLPEIYAETDPQYRLWCAKCWLTFSHPDERHAHEQDPKLHLLRGTPEP